MKLSEVGEFGLIDRLRALVGEPEEGEVWVGDDCAVLRAPAGTIFFTADLLVEGVHFDLELTGPKDLGYKSIAVNASDVAAMGGTPRRALVSLGVRPSFEIDWLLELYAGMRECSDEFGMAVVGGDVSRSDCLVISVALIGNPAGRRVVERKGARPGDAVCVTGVLGASAAGHRLLRAGSRDRPDLIQAHLRPTARVREAEVLRRFLPSSMIDVSDGFAADLGHLLDASGVGAEIDGDLLPVIEADGLSMDRDPMRLALSGGEDYELCFTIEPARLDEAVEKVFAKTGTKITRVGAIVDDPKRRTITIEGVEQPMEARGWDHLT